jgi:hypothetical protein
MKKARQLLYVGILMLVAPGLSGCWMLAAAGAGAYGGYKAKEEGYTLQKPVTKEKSESEHDDD